MTIRRGYKRPLELFLAGIRGWRKACGGGHMTEGLLPNDFASASRRSRTIGQPVIALGFRRIERTSDKRPGTRLRTMRPTRAGGPVLDLDLAELPFVGETHSNPQGTSGIAACGKKKAAATFHSVVNQATASRSLPRRRSLRASADGSLTYLRLRRDSRQTQGQAEAVEVRAVRRDVRVADRRTAIRRDVVPTAATAHAARALFAPSGSMRCRHHSPRYQSWLHSNRLPCRSNKPRILGRNSRGGWTCLPLFSANQPNRPSRLTSLPKP